jgi:AraC-like DNA-binding protein
MHKDSQDYLHIPTIPSDFLVQVVSHLDQSDRLSETLQAEINRIADADKISMAQYIDFYERVRNELQDESLGVFSRPVPLGGYAALCNMVQYSPNILTAIEHYNRFYSLFLPGDETLLAVKHDSPYVIISLNRVAGMSSPALYQQSMLLSLLKLLTWLTAQRVAAEQVSFEFEAMPFSAEFEYLFGTAPTFGGDRASITLPEAVLEYPVTPKISADQYASQSTFNLIYWSVGDDLLKQVYSMIASGLSLHEFDVVTVAASLNVSRHTLARRLKKLGSSYGEVLERVRRDKAVHLLLTTTMSVDDVASLLGYAEIGSFSRAFKQWTGSAPVHYREERR